ncbi:hypothetical protein A3C91_04995 [Candidatus Azambacteria bacterium RIFCSPHIGHO2_02_FULL_52_12]|uniref:Uncharacterized protein n=1 Tax=Candidatus Azambacteria bacterium RIFCSPLOWO2_01_FULL_46_25 TaxID=1797298 RepID=A0A1F5BVW8_9BACT|nr:MAG: hypothetical protein A3C91_04995 [Candidatus Azambacteria bacterium RIFCSPHIGHO2_02_FULL_52_12]OGD34746.1 MAG: hypothetical protein A2988_04605 [Candidatus Azambacteria bacterium RIFCSPLOWO2_01_FULL_46_25]OGD36946.1 MAG: hypothetical protein A2850_00840 [Candidatus Azambacteria bacterium RIFCSPHIGHO2_01_FULL_51_74]
MSEQKCKSCLHAEKRHYQPAGIAESEKDSDRPYIRKCLECQCQKYEKQDFSDELCKRIDCGHMQGDHIGILKKTQFEEFEDGVSCSKCNCDEFVK